MSRAYDEFLARLEEDEMQEHLPEAEALDFPDRDAWLAARKQSIGASDAPAVLGLGRTPLSLYLDKVGIIEPDAVQEPSEAMRWGTLLEPVIRAEAAERLGRSVVHVPYRMHRSRAVPYLTATLDGVLPDPLNGPGVLEIKTAHRHAEDGDEAPLPYQIQVQHQLLVTGLTWGVIAVLYGGQRLVCYTAERNAEAIALLQREHEVFWGRVVTKTPPAIDGSEASARLLRALFPRESGGTTTVLPQVALDWDAHYVQMSQRITELEQARDEAKHFLQNAIGEAEVGLLPDGSGIRYSWKTQSRRERLQPAWSGRVFRRHAARDNGERP